MVQYFGTGIRYGPEIIQQCRRKMKNKSQKVLKETRTGPSSIIFFYLAEENKYAGINHPMIQMHPKKLQLMKILTQRVEKQPGIYFFGDFKMDLFTQKYSGFLTKKSTFSRKIQIDRPE